MPGHAAERGCALTEFLAHEGEPDLRYELVGGKLRPMAPPSGEHGRIMLRLGRRLLERLPPPCQPTGQAGILLPGRDDTFYEADIAVSCAPQPAGSPWVVDPVLVVEILSPSTKAHDRGQKVPDYMTIPGLREILLIDAERRHVQLVSRVPEGWLTRDVIGDGPVPLATVPGGITLDEIYGPA